MPFVLVVDDDDANRAMYARLMQNLATVDEAADGREALALLGRKRYDVVLLDLHLPEIDGHEVLRTLRRDDAHPNAQTPFYVLTADVSDSARTKAAELGAVCILTKPVPTGTLLAFVGATLKSAEARSALLRPSIPVRRR